MMADIACVAGSALFFALMFAYVRGCAALGREESGPDSGPLAR